MSVDLLLRDGLSDAKAVGVALPSDRSDGSGAPVRGGREKPRSRKKTWGIFYTPESLIHHLTQWAVRSATDTILEPSFGGCGFLDACAARLATLGAKEPWGQMAGCDIDLRAFANLPAQFRDPAAQRRFLLANFLATRPANYPEKQYSIVIGNPPYVSRHNMRQYQLETARAAAAAQNIAVPLKASLWAYFVVHSLTFLQIGGKMAWVLPRSLTQGDYGKKIIELLSSRFTRIDILCLGDRAFVGVGADEFVDILLCENFRGCDGAQVRPDIHHLARTPPPETSIVPTHRPTISAGLTAREQALSVAETEAMQVLRNRVSPIALGYFADVRIGLVTGATDFFVLRRSQLNEFGLTESRCRFIVTRFGIAQGLHFDSDDASAVTAADGRVLLVDAKHPDNQSYWKRFPADQIPHVRTFKKRALWNDPDDGILPDAFFPPLIHQYPRLVLNTARANCTNTVHRVLFKSQVSVLQRWAITVLLLSTPAQLSCELIGRQCGSGGLKIEPSDFAKIEIPTPTVVHLQTVAENAGHIDAAIRAGNIERARDLADKWLYDGLTNPPTDAIRAHARGALRRLQAMRFRP